MPASVIAAPATRSSTTLGEVLHPLHERWLAALERAVAPALLGTSSVWDRWTAVRYLRDQFMPRLDQERKLLRQLPQMDRAALDRIEAAYQRLERLRGEIDDEGRRRHTGGLVMLLLRGFLDLLSDWYFAIEHATTDVPLTTLPGEAVRLLTDLEAAGELPT
jgi:hypothetical protein